MKRITALIVAAFFVIYPVIPVMAVEITEAGEVCDFSVSEVCEVTEEDAYKETPSEYMEQPLFESAAAGNLWNGWEEFASDVYRPLGKGTKDEPYGIRNAGNMMWLSVNTAMGTGNISEAFYILQNDIDLSVVRSIAPDGDWNPIGWYLNKNSSEMYNAFKGSFDGNGYTVYGLYISDPNGVRKQNTGLFGVLDGAVIKNLNIRGAYVRGYDNAGILCGMAAGTTEVHDVSVGGSAGTGSVFSESAHIGGIAGNLKGNGSGASEAVVIENCSADNLSAVSAGSVSCVGGIAGRSENVYIVDSFVQASSTALKGAGYVGGITGEQKNTCIYNAYINGTVGGSGTMAAGGVTGRFISGEIFLVQMDGSIGSTNQMAKHEGILIGTRDNASVLSFGNTKTDNAAYLFYDEELSGWPMCASGIKGDSICGSYSAHTGFWTSNELKYSLVEGSNEYPCGPDRYFYEELEDGVRFIVTEKLNRKFSAGDYSRGIRFSIDHFAPGVSGSPVKGHLLSIPQINSRNSSDYDVAYLTAVAGSGSIYYRKMDKDSAGAVAPGTLVTVTSSSKNDRKNNKFFQRTVDETVLPEKLIRPTYTSSENGTTEVLSMDYQSGSSYTFIMPDCDTEINICYEKVLSEIITDPLSTSFSITEVRTGDRKNPDITWNISDENGHLLCTGVSKKRNGGDPISEQLIAFSDVTAIDVNVIFNSISSDNKVIWSVDDPSLVSVEGTESGYTETAAKIRPVTDIGNTWLLSVLSRLEKTQAESGYTLKIPDTEYTKSAVLTAMTSPEHSVDNKAQYAHCTVTVRFRVVDQTFLLAEDVSVDRENIVITVIRKLTGNRRSPSETFEVSAPQKLSASVEPAGADVKSVVWELSGDAASSLFGTVSGDNCEDILIGSVFDGNDMSSLPAWMKAVYEEDNAEKAADRNAVLSGGGTKTGLITATATDRELGIHKASAAVTVVYKTVDESKILSGESSGTGSGTGGSVSGAGTTTTKTTKGSVSGLPSYVTGGNWSLGGNGKWRFASTDGHTYTSEWGAVFNPYAAGDQARFDWFSFDSDSNMRTGWFTDTDGEVYYLSEKSDGTLGHMVVGYQYIGGVWYYFQEKSDGYRGRLIRNGYTSGGEPTDREGRILAGGGVIADGTVFKETQNTTESLKAAGI